MGILSGIFLLLSCSSENAWDCLQTAGDRVQVEYTVGAFDKIRIEDEVSLVIRQGPNQRVVIESGENLLPEVTVQIEAGTLVIRDGNNCNLIRDYELTRAMVTVSNLTEIRNSSSFDITSDGVLTFPQLRLVSNTTGGLTNSRKGGDFYLDIQCQNLTVEANGQSAFYISGTAEEAVLSFEDEFPKFEGANLQIDRLRIFQRSANKMVVNPLNEIMGEIRGTGDVISVHRPPIVSVEEFFTGRLVFQD